ncbi:MAG: hypothetical protein KIT31_16685 [Deltaproteobacteria bacterium]|nr:hypothetical protein [Deltaproteobacteria bacterium]
MSHVAPLYAALHETFYVDEDTMRWAVTTRRSFNAIHLESMIKVDVFCAKDTELARQELARRITLDVEGRSLPVASAEDIILQKLMWFVEAGESERQWGDALGVVKVRGAELDRTYLEREAARIGLTPLLARLLAEGRDERQ